MSRFAIISHDFVWFENPKLSVVRPNGETWQMHDKGVTRCLLDIDGRSVEVETLHMPPFRKFGADILDEQWGELRRDYARKLVVDTDVVLLQGDFNFDEPTVRGLLPDLFTEGFSEQELTTPTTPRGRAYDHVLFKGLVFQLQQVRSEARTDHYPVVTDFILDNRD